MYHDLDDKEFWKRLLSMLEQQFGDHTEFILHDLRGDYSHSIVDIRNGHITGRRIGDSGTNLGLEVLRGTIQDGDRYNYITNTKDGKLLRSSTMFLKDENDSIIGSLCINTDITETVRFEEYLHRHNQFSVPVITETETSAAPSSADPHKVEVFAQDVNQVLDFLINAAMMHVGKPVAEMKRADKIEFIRFLDSKGAFLITKSSERVYELLSISKFTFYSYLDIVHSGTADTAADNVEA